METRIIGFCLPLALLLSTWSARMTLASVIFEDNFEADTVGTALSANTPQVGDHYVQGTVADASTNPPGAAAGGSKFASTGPSLNRWFISPSTQAAITGKTIDFNVDFYIVTDLVHTNNAIDFNTFTDSSFGGRAFDIIIHSDGSLQWYDGVNHNVVGTVATSAWINADVLADYATGTFSATIDGVSFTGDFSFGAGHATSFLDVLPGPDSSAAMFYDNILISTPEPTSLGLIALGWLLIQPRRRRVCADGRAADRRHIAR